MTLDQRLELQTGQPLRRTIRFPIKDQPTKLVKFPMPSMTIWISSP